MTKRLRVAFFGLGMMAVMLPAGAVCTAQQKKTSDAAVAPAPVPAQIRAAKRVFIANGGGDETRNEDAIYSGGPQRVYDEFYAAIKNWGRYELVGSPAEADLVIEIRLTVFQVRHQRVLSDDDAAIDSQFRLVIRDPKTQQKLWGLTEHAQMAVLQSNRDKNFEKALAAVVAEVKRIAGPDAAAKN